MSVQFAMHHRFTVEEFQRMGEAGIFPPDARVELIDGEIIEMTPVGSRHVACVFDLDDLFREMLGREVVVSVQSPVQIEGAHPIPDIAILRRREDRYRDALPQPSDALLVIEVADSSVLYDRNVKNRLYARAGIPEYWVIDLTRNTVVVHHSPQGGEYVEVWEHGRDASFTSPALGERELRVRDLLGPP